MVGLPRNPEDFDVFDLDFAQSGRILVDHLAERGHGEIILITPHQHVYERGGAYAWRFRDAALQQAASHGIRVRSYFGQTQQPAINQQLNEILDARDGSAMIVHNDAVIAALPSVLYSRGIRVPDDLSVVGVYSEDFGRLFSLPYTAVETSPNKLGRMAVQALVQRMTNPGSARLPGSISSRPTSPTGEAPANKAPRPLPEAAARRVVEPLRLSSTNITQSDN